jgi:hypothetical protein
LRELSSLDGLCDPESFFWLKNARFCVEAGDLFMNIADGRFSYGWEYLGVIDRLVYTDLTDRYRTQRFVDFLFVSFGLQVLFDLSSSDNE